MTRTVGLLVLLLGTPGLFGAGPPAPDLAPLVARLGGPDYEQREQAARALEARGSAALPALRAALHSPQPEVRRRASALLRRIESRLDTARVLAPTRLRLSYKDTPLTEAVADFARRAGVAVELAGGTDRWAGQRVTLDTGETTFWEALARFSSAAGLHERAQEGTFPAPKGKPGGIAYLDEAALARLGKLEGPLVLEDGKVPSLPTCVAGSLRVRALPAGERTLTLELSPEPRLAWQSVTFLRIDRAVDDRGRLLTPPAPYLGVLPPVDERPRRVVLLDRVQWPENTGVRRVSFRLPAGKAPARRLRELRGTVGAWVGAPPEELARFDEILKAQGRSTKARDGSSLKVTDVGRGAGGLYHVAVELTGPRPPSDLIPAGARVSRIGSLRSSRTPLPARSNPFTLLDDRGRAFPVLAAEFDVGENETKKRFLLVYRARKGGPPAALVYTARRSVFVEVPFVLRDVPLAGP